MAKGKAKKPEKPVKQVQISPSAKKVFSAYSGYDLSRISTGGLSYSDEVEAEVAEVKEDETVGKPKKHKDAKKGKQKEVEEKKDKSPKKDKKDMISTEAELLSEMEIFLEYHNRVKELRASQVQEHKLEILKQDPNYVEVATEPIPDQEIELEEKKKSGTRLRLLKTPAELQAIERENKRKTLLLEQERIFNTEKQIREAEEHAARSEYLDSSREFMQHVLARYKKTFRNYREQQDWEIYLSCRPLPNASNVQELNKYIYKWKKSMALTTLEDTITRVNDTLQLLGELEVITDNVQDHELYKMNNWMWVKDLLQENLHIQIEIFTLRLIRDLEKRLNRISIPVADFRHKDTNFTLCLWCYVQLPTHMPNPRRPSKPRISVNFSEMQMSVVFPPNMPFERQVIRALYVPFDHITCLCETYHYSFKPNIYMGDLKEVTSRDYNDILKVRYDNYHIKCHQEAKAKAATLDYPTYIGPLVIPKIESNESIPVMPYKPCSPTGSFLNLAREDIAYYENMLSLKLELPPGEINLRNHLIVGGLYTLSILNQPTQPQPYYTRYMTVAPILLPKRLEFDNPEIIYDPPPLHDSDEKMTASEFMEYLQKKEIALENTIYVTMNIPSFIMFTSSPIVCFWDNEKKVWSTNDILEPSYDVDEGKISFRTTKFGIYSLTCPRYGHLPYESWKCYPDDDKSVTFVLTTPVTTFTFNIKGFKIALVFVKFDDKRILWHLRGKYMLLSELKKVLRYHGVELFPDDDAFAYIEKLTCEKHHQMEKELYMNLAIISSKYELKQSKFNLYEDRRNAVLQLRLMDVRKAPYKLVLVTPYAAYYLKCTESAEEFNNEPLDGSKFAPTLWFLMRTTAKVSARGEMMTFPKETIHVLFQFYSSLRFMSFC